MDAFEQAQADATMCDRYISNADYRRQKAALTRAVNSKDVVKILDAIEKTLDEWEGKAWPDDWHRWRRALDDVFYAYTTNTVQVDYTLIERFHDLSDRLN